MDSKAQLTVDIIAKVAENKITINNATKLLNKSRRNVERYLQQYHKVGIQFVVHGNTGDEGYVWALRYFKPNRIARPKPMSVIAGGAGTIFVVIVHCPGESLLPP